MRKRTSFLDVLAWVFAILAIAFQVSFLIFLFINWAFSVAFLISSILIIVICILMTSFSDSVKKNEKPDIKDIVKTVVCFVSIIALFSLASIYKPSKDKPDTYSQENVLSSPYVSQSNTNDAFDEYLKSEQSNIKDKYSVRQIPDEDLKTDSGIDSGEYLLQKTPPPVPQQVAEEEPISGIYVSASDTCDDYNYVGNEWSIHHYARFEGYPDYVEVPDGGAWYDLSDSVTIYVKTVIVEEDDVSPDRSENSYNTYLDIDDVDSGCWKKFEINQDTYVMEDESRYAGNECKWVTNWDIEYVSGTD